MEKLVKRFGLKPKFRQDDFVVKPRYNLAPSEMAPAIVQEGGDKRLEFMTWGLTRQWNKDKPPHFIINLKAEKLAAGPFKSVLTKRRCLIPADGFYEWKADTKPKQPYRFTLKDDSIFAFPAIFDEAPPDAVSPTRRYAGTPIRTFCIFTTPANPLIASIHHRMPAILPPDLEEAWLDPQLTDVQKIVDLLKPYPETAMKSWAVSPAINSARIDSPEVIKPI